MNNAVRLGGRLAQEVAHWSLTTEASVRRASPATALRQGSGEAVFITRFPPMVRVPAGQRDFGWMNQGVVQACSPSMPLSTDQVASDKNRASAPEYLTSCGSSEARTRLAGVRRFDPHRRQHSVAR